MVRQLVGMVWVRVGTWVMYFAYKTSHKYRNSRMHVSIYIMGFTEHWAAGKIKLAQLLPWKSMPPHGKSRRRGTSIPLCVCCLRASSSQEVNYFSLHACLPYGSCRALLVMLGECGSLTPGNTSRTPGGLPGMLLNNEVHSLTSPSKAKFPCCPFQTGTATLTRVTPPTAKKNTSSCFSLWQARWLLLRGMKNKQVHYQSLMPGYSYNYHMENDLLCLLCHGEAVSS